MAKLPGGQGLVEAANVGLQMHGGFGFACEYDIERKFARRGCTRCADLDNLIFSYVAEHLLGLPRVFDMHPPRRCASPPSLACGGREAHPVPGQAGSTGALERPASRPWGRSSLRRSG